MPRAWAAFALAVIAAGAPDAESCSIGCGPEAAGVAFTIARPIVFAGKVVSIDEPQGEPRYTLEPVRVWSGTWPGDKRRFRLVPQNRYCSMSLVLGAYYLVGATREPETFGPCHQVVPLARASWAVETLDRRAGLDPMALPKWAFLSPGQIQCPPSPITATVDRKLRDAELVVSGRLAPLAGPGRDEGVGAVWIHSPRVFKGAAESELRVELGRSYAVHTRGKDEELVLFLGARKPDGVRGVLFYIGPNSGVDIASRVEKIAALGLDCAPGTLATPEGRRR